MSWSLGIFTYIVTWCVVWMAVMPFGARSEENPQAGHAPSAPAKGYFKQKALAATLISAVIVGFLAWVTHGGAPFLTDRIPRG